MNGLGFFLSGARIAWKNLLRSGERVLAALLCIAFGVMSLVALTLVSQSFSRATVLQPGEQIGADISLSRQAEDTITPEQLEALRELQASGEIDRFTLMAYNSSLAYHRPGSGEMRFAASGMGIEPAEYPLAGALTVSEPGNGAAPGRPDRAGRPASGRAH
jgi:putative ABC transport system permease protein